MCKTEDVLPSEHVLVPVSRHVPVCATYRSLGHTKPGHTSRNQHNIFLLFYCFQSLLPTLLPKLGQLSSSMTWELEWGKRGYSDVLKLQDNAPQAKQAPSTPLNLHLQRLAFKVHKSDFCYATGCCYFQKTSSSAKAGYYFAGGSLSKPLTDWKCLNRPRKHRVWQNLSGLELVFMNPKLARVH